MDTDQRATFITRGYRIVDSSLTSHSTAKHAFLKLERDGKFYFAKYSINSDWRKGSIIVDTWWGKTINQLDLPFRTPGIIEYSTNWYIADFIDGKPCALSDQPGTALEPYLDKIVASLAALDAVDSSTLQPPEQDNSTPYNQLDRRWDRWTEHPLEQHLLTPAELAAARKILADYAAYVTPRLQHGDCVPWHFMQSKNGNLYLIDGEHASVHKPRFYDLAYMYTRVYTLMHGKEQAIAIVRGFLRTTNISEADFYPAFLPVLTSRSIGVLFDALRDNTYNEYRAEAKELLAICLSRDPKRLLA